MNIHRMPDGGQPPVAVEELRNEIKRLQDLNRELLMALKDVLSVTRGCGQVLHRARALLSREKIGGR